MAVVYILLVKVKSVQTAVVAFFFSCVYFLCLCCEGSRAIVRRIFYVAFYSAFVR